MIISCNNVMSLREKGIYYNMDVYCIQYNICNVYYNFYVVYRVWYIVNGGLSKIYNNILYKYHGDYRFFVDNDTQKKTAYSTQNMKYSVSNKSVSMLLYTALLLYVTTQSRLCFINQSIMSYLHYYYLILIYISLLIYIHI